MGVSRPRSRPTHKKYNARAAQRGPHRLCVTTLAQGRRVETSPIIQPKNHHPKIHASKITKFWGWDQALAVTTFYP